MDSMSVIACSSAARISTAGLWESANSKMPGLQGANLFFMNPAGVLFGRHAQLDVSGSVAVTTANYLNLVGGGQIQRELGRRRCSDFGAGERVWFCEQRAEGRFYYRE